MRRYFIFLIFAGIFLASPVLGGAGDNLSGWAWSENIGWIHFNDANYGVNVAADGTISGFAWSENIGWVNFSGATLDKITGKVTGTISAIAGVGRTDGWDGTIKLSGTAQDGSPYGVSVTDCDWSGWAWGSDVVGWIHFKGSNYGVVGTGDACITTAVCTSGQTETQSCTTSQSCPGTQTRTCDASGNWGLFGTCGDVAGDNCPLSCGDNVCNGAETCSTCPADCGVCVSGNGDIKIKRVGPANTISSAPPGTQAWIDSLSPVSANPADFIDVSAGSETAFVSKPANYTVSVGDCIYAGVTECAVSSFQPAICSGSSCSASISVQSGHTTKAVFKYILDIPECSDGIDNDGDGHIDMNDPGCDSPDDNDEGSGVKEI